MNFNRKFIPNVWEAPRQAHPILPFVNNQQNFYPIQGNSEIWNNQGNSNYKNFQQNHQNQNIRPLPHINTSGPDHQHFRKFNNNNNTNNQDYRRPGPACSRNNYNNNSGRWNKDNRRGDFKKRETIGNGNFQQPQQNNNNNRSSFHNDYNNHPPSDGNEASFPKFNSLVDHLKAFQNSKLSNNQQESSQSDIDAICVKNASNVSKKLLTQLKTMDKDGVKDLVNNPKTPYKKKVLNLQAREKLRQQMREKLKRLGNESDSLVYQLEPDECIDYEKIPESLIAQIGRTIDIGVESDEMDLSESINECNTEDKDIEVVTKNLGSDFLMGSEMLLMNGFSLLGDTDLPPIPSEPPLPFAPPNKPPTPPPEPEKTSQEKTVFSSLEIPWSGLPVSLPKNSRLSVAQRNLDEEWKIKSGKNPDPPCVTSKKEEEEKYSLTPQPVPLPVPPPTSTAISSVKEDQPLPVPPPLCTAISGVKEEQPLPVPPPLCTPISGVKEEQPLPVPPPATAVSIEQEEKPLSNDVIKKKTPADEIKEAPVSEDDEWNVPESISKPINEQSVQPQESGKKANETYGDYRRRLAAERNQLEAENHEGSNNIRPQFQTGFNLNRNNDQNQRRGNNWRGNNKGGRGGVNGSKDWVTNNRQNNGNESNHQNRKSRNEMDRGCDRNNFQQRNLSRDTNRSLDNGRQDKAFDDVKDVHNYRFQNDRNSQEPPIERLNTLLNPKPLHFKGSFNKRAHTSSHFQRSRSRDHTPVNNSMERDFDESLLPSVNDVQPCLTTLKKLMDTEAEMNRIHDKIHGIDKVISNLQSERISYQKTFARIQHNRKVLFDNLMKRATQNLESDKTETHSRAAAPSPVNEAIPSTSQKSVAEKRKHDEQLEEPKKKKPAFEETTTSAAAKAAQLQKEREEQERLQKVLEKKRLKKLRKKREQAEKERLEERIRQEAAAATTVKVVKREKSVDKSKNNKHQHQQQGKSQKEIKSEKPKELNKIIFKQSETLPNENILIIDCCIKLNTVLLSDNLKEQFTSSGFLSIDLEDWNKWYKPVNDETIKKDEKIQIVQPVKEKSPEIRDPLEIPECNNDPLAIDEVSTNPPTPGSNISPNNDDEDSMLVEIPSEQDYSEWTGNFTCHDQPIVHLQNINGKFVVCATENGKVYKYHLCSNKIAGVFSKHTQICNSFLYDGLGSIYTVSSDGFLHKIKFKSFQLVASENFDEELQVIEKSKAGIFVGTKTGRIFRINADLSEREPDPICNLGTLILCMRASREGSRNILLVSSKTNAIQVRDANDGLLLRTMANDLTGVSIYDILIEGSTIYCGSDRKIFSIDFHTGALKKSRPCGGVAICVKLYKNQLIVACYNGNIYVFNTKNDDDAVNICGPANMLLAMDLWDDKIIAATKDKTLKIMSIQT